MAYGLIDMGLDTKKDALKGMNEAAAAEGQRKMQNETLKDAEKQRKISNTATGATAGAMIGAGTAVGGPWGTAVGAAVGLLSSFL